MSTTFIYTLLAAGLLTSSLLNDYQRDKGQNKKAKTMQAVLLGILVLCYADSPRYLGWLFRHYNEALERFGVEVGIFSGAMQFKFFVVHVILSNTVLVLAFLMAKRKQKARSYMLGILPFLALPEIFNFYRGWLNSSGNQVLSHTTILLLGLVVIGTPFAGFEFAYSSKLMRNFFNYDAEMPSMEGDPPQPPISDL